MPPDPSDDVIRNTVFQFLASRTDGGRNPISWSALQNDCKLNGERLTIIGAHGIWKSAGMSMPISIATAPAKANRPAPYDDHFDDDGHLIYRYNGTDPMHPHNVGLRNAMEQAKGLVYLHGIERGWYQATWPVYITEDHPENLSVKVVMADPGTFRSDLDPSTLDRAERRYYERVTKQRLHQAEFRQRVLRAYQRSCGFCRLKHPELLDAAHIRPDSGGGSAATSNGLSLCKIHHAAFDHQIVGIRPDHVLEIRQDVLDEVDGPMLRYGLQALNQQKLILPKKPTDRPDAEAIEERYELFLSR